MRALRPDKLTIAALVATLALYRDGRRAEIPVLARLAATDGELRARAERLAAAVGGVVAASISTVGGGAMPTAAQPSWAVVLDGEVATLDARLRAAPVPVIARIADDRLWLDVRTIGDDEVAEIAAALR